MNVFRRMSFDEYARYIAHKYRIAISIAVLKTKPPNVTVDDHVQNLRNVFDNDKSDFDTVSLNSNDFAINENDVDDTIDGNDLNNVKVSELNSPQVEMANEILKADQIDKAAIAKTNDTESLDQVIEINDTTKSKSLKGNRNCLNLDVIKANNQNTDEINENDVHNEINDEEMIEAQALNDSIKILGDFIDPVVESMGQNNLEEVIDILRGIDENGQTIEMAKEQPKHCLQTDYENIDLTHTQNFNEDNTNLYFDNRYNDRNLILDLDLNFSLHYKDSKTHHRESLVANTQNDTKTESLDNLKPNQSNFKNFEKIYKIKRKSVKQNVTNIENDYNEIENTQFDMDMIVTELKKRFQDNLSFTKEDQNSNTITNELEYKLSSPDKKRVKVSDKVEENTETLTVGNTMNSKVYTHYSETQQTNVIVIEDKYIHGTHKKDKNPLNNKTKKIDVRDHKVYKLNTINKQEPINVVIESKPESYLNHKSKAIYVSANNEKIDKETNDVVIEISREKSQAINNEQFSQELFLSGQSSFIESSNKETYKKKNNVLHDIITQEMFPPNSIEISHKIKDLPKNLANDSSRKSSLDTFTTFSESYQNFLNCTLVSRDTQNMNDFDTQNTNFELDITRNNKAFDKNCTDSDKTGNIAHNEREKDLDNDTEREKYNTDVIKSQNCMKDNLEFSQNPRTLTVNNNHKDKPITDDSNPKDTPIDDTDCVNFDDDLEECTDSHELVPFKIVEEMNKAKLFLSGKNLDVHSCDTGYKSDSQSRSSMTLSQTPSWVSQSAHSLFDYIMGCLLTDGTEDIANEISVVLGELIDRFHDEENYPVFLGELLESLKALLKLLFEERFQDNALSKKDELTERILLLNKSMHIQKFTIEKITNILEDLLNKLTDKQKAIEVDNIDHAENICYIFNLLHILLQKHKKQCTSSATQNSSQATQNSIEATQNLSQPTQNSQDILKKSYISDVWRRKWNPHFKSSSDESSLENKCVISACGIILNKIIVNCMDGYSLISYYALKCYNVMQT